MTRTADIDPHDRGDRRRADARPSTARGAGARTTGVGFLDHMLDLLARHGRLDLSVDVAGDLETGAHHTVEDTGIVLGQALDRALGDRAGIPRYGHAVVPMDEARASCAIDISGRPFCAYGGLELPAGRHRRLRARAGRGVLPRRREQRAADPAPELEAGTNAHHMIEACFKAFARALRGAVAIDPTETGDPVDQGHADVSTVALVDYGMGNRRSVEKALEHVGAQVRRDRATTTRSARADGLVLPGVGAFPAAMRRLRELGLDERHPRARGGGTPLLGSASACSCCSTPPTSTRAPTGLGLLAGEVAPARPGARSCRTSAGTRCAAQRASPLTRGPGRARGLLPRALVRRRARRARDVLGDGRLRRARSRRSSRATTSSACSSTPRSPRATGSRCCATSRDLRADAA